VYRTAQQNASLSGGLERMNVRDLALQSSCGIPQVNVALQVKPELGRHPEQLAKPDTWTIL
jgi:hypothetical protein